MGSNQSKSGSTKAPLFDRPWRDIPWGDKQNALQYVKNYKPPTEGQQIRILLHGPVGAGKSSFINSVQSILHGRMYAQALADNTAGASFTKMYNTYKIRKEGQGSFYPFVFSDIMGLEAYSGVLVDDVKLALKGHVKKDYRFNPESKLSEDNQFYNKYPKPNDKVHVLVCVVPADKAVTVAADIVPKIKEIRREASELKIPQVILLTKIDQACPEIGGDLKNVYKVKKVKEKMEEFSAEVGVPMNCIFPVKNYDSEIDLNVDIDSLILSAMKNIINFGDDCISFQMNQSECSDTYA